MAYYYYFIASLPALTFGAAPPFSVDAFVEKSRDWISKKDFAILSAAREFRDAPDVHPAYGQWLDWERALRNRLVEIRAGRLKREAAPFLKGADRPAPAVATALSDIAKSDDPLSAEYRLDQLRWHFLDELAAFHLFDLEYLLTYLLKLGILQRWNSMNEEEGETILNELSTIDGTMETH